MISCRQIKSSNSTVRSSLSLGAPGSSSTISRTGVAPNVPSLDISTTSYSSILPFTLSESHHTQKQQHIRASINSKSNGSGPHESTFIQNSLKCSHNGQSANKQQSYLDNHVVLKDTIGSITEKIVKIHEHSILEWHHISYHVAGLSVELPVSLKE